MVPGQTGRIEAFEGDGREVRRLMEMGLIPGTEVRFVRTAPLGDPLEIELRGYNLSLRRAEAALISVSAGVVR